VSLLLADMRIDINTPNNYQCTPLWFASQNGHLPVVQLILASGMEVNTKTKSIAGTASWSNKTAAEVGRFQEIRPKMARKSEEDSTRAKQNGPLIAALIDSFDLDPVHTRQQLREHPELRDSSVISLPWWSSSVTTCWRWVLSPPPTRRQPDSSRSQRGCPWNCRWFCATGCLVQGRTMCSPSTLSLRSRSWGNCWQRSEVLWTTQVENFLGKERRFFSFFSFLPQDALRWFCVDWRFIND